MLPISGIMEATLLVPLHLQTNTLSLCSANRFRRFLISTLCLSFNCFLPPKQLRTNDQQQINLINHVWSSHSPAISFFSKGFYLTVSPGVISWIILHPPRLFSEAEKPLGKVGSVWGVGCANPEHQLALAEKVLHKLQRHLFLCFYCPIIVTLRSLVSLFIPPLILPTLVGFLIITRCESTSGNIPGDIILLATGYTNQTRHFDFLHLFDAIFK